MGAELLVQAAIASAKRKKDRPVKDSLGWVRRYGEFTEGTVTWDRESWELQFESVAERALEELAEAGLVQGEVYRTLVVHIDSEFDFNEPGSLDSGSTWRGPSSGSTEPESSKLLSRSGEANKLGPKAPLLSPSTSIDSHAEAAPKIVAAAQRVTRKRSRKAVHYNEVPRENWNATHLARFFDDNQRILIPDGPRPNYGALSGTFRRMLDDGLHPVYIRETIYRYLMRNRRKLNGRWVNKLPPWKDYLAQKDDLYADVTQPGKYEIEEDPAWSRPEVEEEEIDVDAAISKMFPSSGR